MSKKDIINQTNEEIGKDVRKLYEQINDLESAKSVYASMLFIIKGCIDSETAELENTLEDVSFDNKKYGDFKIKCRHLKDENGEDVEVDEK